MEKKLIAFLAALSFLVCTGTGLEAATLRVPEDYSKIQGAVDAALPGDSIVIGDGFYEENVLIKKTLAIKAKGPAGAAVITADNIYKPTVTITETKDVSLDGFTITGSDISGLMLLEADTCTIAGNTLTGNAKGMVLLNSNGNSITDNEIDENTQYGIYLDKSNFNTISDNSVDENGDKGIFLSNSNNNAIVGNHANLNMWNGVLIWSSKYNLVTENKTLRNTYGIVESESEGNVITNNTVWPNIFIILPVLLIYAGILTYLIQKRLLRLIYGA